MQIREPLYRFLHRTGKYCWLFAAFATWILGFATWQVMYLLESSALDQKLKLSLSGPNDFASVFIGDCFVLPGINALIILSYQTIERLGKNKASMASSELQVYGGLKLSSIAALVGIAAAVGTYTLWFAVKKVDWTIPSPGVLNAAGVYHAIFLATEVYIFFNFFLIIIQTIFSYERWDKNMLPLVRITASIYIFVDIFVLALLVDVHHHLIPVNSYIATKVPISLLIVINTLVILRKYKGKLNILFHDIWSSLLLLTSLVGAILVLCLS